MRTSIKHLGYGSLLCSLLFGCAVAVERDDVRDGDREVAGLAAAIVGGTTVDPNNSGAVKVIASGAMCSGTLIRNRWVLTASHCVNLDYDRDFTSAVNGYVFINDQVNVESTAAVAKFDASGRLVVAGSFRRTDQTTGSLFYLRRFTSSGAVDTSFGNQGVVTTDFIFSANETITDIAFQPNGQIVAVGWSTFNNQHVFAFARYNTNGSLDGFFGLGGTGQTIITGQAAAMATGVALDAQGRIVVSGLRVNPNSTSDPVIARYTTTGAADNSFDGDGQWVSPIPNKPFSQANDVAIDASGKIAIAGTGSAFDTGSSAFVLRMSAAGVLDSSFGTGGRMLFPSLMSFQSSGTTLLVQGSQILLGGRINSVAMIARVTAGGVLDAAFGGSGLALPSVINQENAQTVGLALTSDGRIRVAIDAYSSHYPGHQPALATLSANGLTSPDRFGPETQTRIYPTDFGLETQPTSIAVSGTRVAISGVREPVVAETSVFLVLQPDRTSDSTFTDPNDGVGVTMGTQGGTNGIVVDGAYLSPNNDDVALLHLAAPLSMNGNSTTYQGPAFYSGSFSALVGTDTLCKGYGANNFDGTGLGTLRQGTGRVISVDDRYINFDARPAPAAAQYPYIGDSGTSCASSASTQIGLFVRRSGSPVLGNMLRADRFSSWVNATVASP